MNKKWKNVKLEDVVDILDNLRKPITKRDRIEGDYPYYGATGILSYVNDYIFSEKLVLIGEDGAKWDSGDNTAFIVEGKYWVNNHAHVIRPNRDKVLDEWIVYYINYRDLSPFVTGMTVPKLNQKNLRSIPIPLPPLPKQHRIVSILDHCFEAIDKAKANAEQNLQNAKELFESYIQSLFEDEKWERKSIEDVCNAVFAGGDAPRNNMSKELTDKYQIPIYANAVKDRGLYGYTDVARVTKPSITIAGRGSGTGHTEIRTEPFLPIVRLIVCEPDTNQIILEFLKYSIDNLVIDISGSAIPQLTIPMIKKYEIPIASLDEQIKIVEKLEELKEQTQQLQSHYQKKLFDLEELKQSILQKAFAGELKTEKMVEETPLVPISESVCCEAEKI